MNIKPKYTFSSDMHLIIGIKLENIMDNSIKIFLQYSSFFNIFLIKYNFEADSF